jgi:D-alanyl-D-alanine carboxypeptidase
MKFLPESRRQWLVAGGLALIIAGWSYDAWCYVMLSEKLGATEQTLATRTGEYATLFSKLHAQNDTLTATLNSERIENGSLSQENSQISDKVSVLTKLTTIDPELLKKYSKVYFLNENYVPAKLSNINPAYVVDTSKTLQFESDALPHLESLLKDANAAGVPLRLASAYRSFGTQSALKASYSFVYGKGTANQFSADQGYSEHQLGTAVDFTTPTIKGAYPAFETDPSFPWLQQNAYKYGFILSYPKSNTYYEFEPWHWRFVGVELATYLHSQGKNFYDLDQRTIDTYLVNIFDN